MNSVKKRSALNAEVINRSIEFIEYKFFLQFFCKSNASMFLLKY